MKISFVKIEHGGLLPATELEEKRMEKFKTGTTYEVEIKESRNPKFHGKVFSFMNFVYQYWSGENEFLDEQAQFDRFRKDLTILAGYNNKVFNYKGELRLEAKSLSYSSMTQEEFEQLYTALINAASKHMFNGADDNIIDKLQSFF